MHDSAGIWNGRLKPKNHKDNALIQHTAAIDKRQ